MKYASWNENPASHAPSVQGAARALETVIRAEIPDVVVHYDGANGLLGWVNLQLAHGALLPNPDGLIENTGKRIRHVKVRSGEMGQDSRIARIVRAAVEAQAG